ncbi:hypothetical protein ACQ4PT_008729 [Festuca glaucescens]
MAACCCFLLFSKRLDAHEAELEDTLGEARYLDPAGEHVADATSSSLSGVVAQKRPARSQIAGRCTLGHAALVSPVSSTAAQARRRREIRMGKRPLLTDGESSSGFPTPVFADVPLPSTAPSPVVPSRVLLPESSARFPMPLFGDMPLPSTAPSPVVSPRLLLPVDYVLQTVLLLDLQYCLGPACSLVTSYPTPSVSPLPFVEGKEDLLNRRKRRVIHNLQLRRVRVPLSGPPFSDKCIAMLKALSSERSYYGVPAYTCEKCGVLFWHYNSLFAFTSMGADVDRTINSGGAPYIFKMGGCAYHRIGSLLPRGTDPPKFAQLYMVDSADEVQRRLDLFGREDIVGEGGCTELADPLIVRELTEMLDQHNHLVHQFRFARRRLQSSDCPNVVIRFVGDEGGSHGTRFSGPTACEVAALIVGDLTPEINRFDVVAETHSHELRQVSSLNPSLMALQYPLLFPYGDKGFHLGIKYVINRSCSAGHSAPRHVSVPSSSIVLDESTSSSRDEVSMLEYYSYYFHYRRNEPNPYTCCGRLSQQIIVNAYSCVEASRLAYHFWNQEALRSETYQGITDAVGEGSSTGKNLGVQYILHSSFTGGPRYMVQNYHDGMAITRVHGAPDLFVTFTCNPKWQEISDALAMEPHQCASDRPDIVTRVFRMKYNEFLAAVKSGELFGPIKAYLYVVEFQKRGLPHTHTLIWLKRNTKEPSSSLIDSFVSAELPDPEKDPLGYVLVDEFMVHGPCDDKGFPVYHRRDDGRFVLRNKGTVELTNKSLFHKTMLTEWFVANENHPEARDLTYLDFPTGWVWNASQKVWTKRRQKRKIATRIGRIYHVHPSTGELFFLRMLLLVATGATCFEDLRRYNGILHSSFKAACQARGLVGDDNEWFNLFEEAIVWATPFQLRHLFMTVLLYCEVINGDILFDRYWRSMGEDISYRISTSLPGYVVPDVYIQDEVLKELSAMFARNGSSLASFNISSRSIPADGGPYNRLIAEETYYDLQELSVQGEAMRQNLNADQSLIFSQIMYSIDTDTPKVYFVSGHGGTGKTFLWNCIVTVLRSERRIVLAVASSGVASLLLPNGRTAHSRFRIPLNANDKSQCNISRGSTMAALLEETSLILWDEAPMTSRYCFEALDRTLRDVLSVNDTEKSALPFGRKTVIFGGDFRQVLPVIEGGSRNEIIDASLIASPLWRHVTVLRLKENMRLKRPDISPSECEQLSLFAQWILDVGNGDVPGSTRDGEDSGSWTTIPEDLLLRPPSSNVDTAIQSVYESFFFNYSSADYLAQRSILCPTNTVVDEINDSIFERVPGCARRYLSSDSISKSTDHAFDAELLYPPEFLHSVTINNFPHHELNLKVGVPVMLLRNINQSLGLCNGFLLHSGWCNYCISATLDPSTGATVLIYVFVSGSRFSATLWLVQLLYFSYTKFFYWCFCPYTCLHAFCYLLL